VDGARSVHGCGSVHAVVELREDARELHHLTGHYLGSAVQAVRCVGAAGRQMERALFLAVHYVQNRI